MKYWVIEHPQLGVYTGHEWKVVSSHVVWRPMFNNIRPTIRGHRFYSVMRAREVLRRVSQLNVVGCKIQGPFDTEAKRRGL